MGNELSIDPEVMKKTTEQGVAQDGKIRYAASGMKGWRVTMEDCHTLCHAVPIEATKQVLTDHSLFGVYDGHGGNMTSVYAGKMFVDYLSRRLEMKKYASLPKAGNKSRGDVTGIDLLKSALAGCFEYMDDNLRKLQALRNEELAKSQAKNARDYDFSGEIRRSVIERSGSTCVVVMITPTHILCANAGDSRAILKRGNRVLPLSFDHKPNNLPEQQRILTAGGFVKAKRVDGDLAVSRGLGDFGFKSEPKMPVHKQKVVAKPEFILYPRDEAQDEFIVLACDGVWDVANNSQCCKMVQDIMSEGEPNLGLVAEEMLDICLEKNSRDNMTLVIVCFPGAKILPKGHPLADDAAVAKRRKARRSRLLEFEAKQSAQNAANGVGRFNLGLASSPPREKGIKAQSPRAGSKKNKVSPSPPALPKT